ncbi:hypothetical protein LZZ85_17405 [Terrimonas sp. NA20]|uniref:UDP-N-acetylglucosamine 2-epimerase domain-containing protein n=1 Tax=Terrimonas ginsenosidimutans TaxID=2908004 RepID=A0ABS9KUQ4_9BACT|nr:hypothetical protein [Terrimonas ginsenosidimutans]MCG2616077.1 hypothetical protein [Terrimonas ginsenosidimutans]
MRNFDHFSEVDNYFAQLFLEEDNAFSKVIYRDAPVGLALQHNLYDYFRRFVFAAQSRGSLFQRLAFKVRTYGWDHRIKFLMNRAIASSSHGNIRGRIVFFADNFVPRILDDFLKVIVKMDSRKVAFCTSDYRAYSYIKKNKRANYPVILFGGKSKRRNIAAKKQAVQDLELQVYPILEKEFGYLAAKMRNIIKANLNILTDYYDLFYDQLDELKPEKIVLGSDGFSVSRVICFAARQLGIETCVLQHGFIDSQNGYLPLIADNLFCWSVYEKKFFERKGVSSERLFVAGSPRFENTSWLQGQTDPKSADELLFVICPGIPQDVYDQIDQIRDIGSQLKTGYKIRVRPHPYYKDLAVSYFKTKQIDNAVLDEDPFLQSINQSSLVVFGNVSTGVFETVGLGRSVYILSGTQNKFDIYGFPRIEKSLLLKGLNEGVSLIKEYDILNAPMAGSASLVGAESSSVIADMLIAHKGATSNL